MDQAYKERTAELPLPPRRVRFRPNQSPRKLIQVVVTELACSLAGGGLCFALWHLAALLEARSSAAGFALRAIGAILLIGSLLILLDGIRVALHEVPELGKQRYLVRHGRAAQATVIKAHLHQGHSHGLTVHDIAFLFEDHTETEVVGTITRNFDTGLKEGDTLTVLYSPRMPGKHLIWAESPVEVLLEEGQ